MEQPARIVQPGTWSTPVQLGQPIVHRVAQDDLGHREQLVERAGDGDVPLVELHCSIQVVLARQPVRGHPLGGEGGDDRLVRVVG
jgi:hypothetical protein